MFTWQVVDDPYITNNCTVTVTHSQFSLRHSQPMFVSRPQVYHGNDLRSSSTWTDTRVRAMSNLVASNTTTLTTHTGDVSSIAFSHICLATCSSDKSVRLWNANDYEELSCSPLLGHKFQIHCASFSPTGSVLATCSTDGSLRLWDVKSGDALAILQHPSKSAIRVCQFSADGLMIVTGGDDDLACLWNVNDKKLIRTLQGHDESVTAAAFSPDTQYIVTASSGGDLGGDLLVWDAQYGHGRYLTRMSDCHDLGVTCCQFSPTYRKKGKKCNQHEFLLATAGKDNLIKLWNFECEIGSVHVSVKLDTMLPGHADTVLWLCFSPNGKNIASCSLDKTARLWNAETKQSLLTLDSHTSFVSSCAFSSDSSTLATGSNDHTVKIWKLTDTSSIMDGLFGFEEGDTPVAGPFSLVAMETWSVEDVCQWLKYLNLEDYEETFCQNAIDGKELMGLSSEDLETSLKVSALGHRNKILRSRAVAQHQPINSSTTEPADLPEEFLCPISQEMMKDPVIASDGYTYDRPAIMSWMKTGQPRSPMTNMLLPSLDLTPNRTLKMMIQKHLQ